MIEMACFTVLQSQIGGRGTETATRKFKHLRVVDFYNDGTKSPQFKLKVRRDKNAKQQDPRLFPQADQSSWYKDFYFLLGILLLYRCNGNCGLTKPDFGSRDPIFPSFYEEAAKDKKKEKNGQKKTSLVSSYFAKQFGKICKRMEDDPEQLNLPRDSKLNKKLGAHGARKYTAQTLADMGECAIWILFRLGLIMKSVSLSFFILISELFQKMLFQYVNWFLHNGETHFQYGETYLHNGETHLHNGVIFFHNGETYLHNGDTYFHYGDI